MTSLYEQAATIDPVSVIRLNEYMRQGLLNSELYQLGINGIVAPNVDSSRMVVSDLLSRIRNNPALIQNQALIEIGNIHKRSIGLDFDMQSAAVEAAQGGIAEQIMARQQRVQQSVGQTQAQGYLSTAGAEEMAQPPEDVFSFLKEANKVEKAINVYMQRPELFSVEHVRQLQEYAERHNLPFDPFPTPEHAVRLGQTQRKSWSEIFEGATTESIIEQGIAGAVEGFTTFPDESVGSPKNLAEEFSRSIGHLLGFVGFGSHKSIPLLGAEIAGKAIGIEKASAWVGKKLLNAGASGRLASTAAGMVGGSFNLGAAMAVSARLGGPSAMLDSFFGGAKAGAVFGSLRLLPGNAAMMKSFGALAGAAYESVPTYREQGFSPQFMYDMLLGAFFGYKEGAAGHAQKSDPNNPWNFAAALKSDPVLAERLQPMMKFLSRLGHRFNEGSISYDALRRDGDGNYAVDVVSISGSPDKEIEIASSASKFGIKDVSSNSESNQLYETLKKRIKVKTDEAVGERKYTEQQIDSIMKRVRSSVESEDNDSINKIVAEINAEVRRDLNISGFDVSELISNEVFDMLHSTARFQIEKADVAIMVHSGIKQGMDITDALKLVKEGLGTKRLGEKDVGSSLFDSIMAGSNGGATLVFVDGSGKKYMLDGGYQSSRLTEIKDEELHRHIIPRPSERMNVRIIVPKGKNNDTITAYENGAFQIVKMLQKYGNQTHREIDAGLAITGGTTKLHNFYTFPLKEQEQAIPLKFNDGTHELQLSYNADVVTIEMQRVSGGAPYPAKIAEDVARIREAFRKEFKINVGVNDELGPNSSKLTISRKVAGKHAPAISPEKIVEIMSNDGVGFRASGLMGVALDRRLAYQSRISPQSFVNEESRTATQIGTLNEPSHLVVQFNTAVSDGTPETRSVHMMIDLDGRHGRVMIPNKFNSDTGLYEPLISRREQVSDFFMPRLAEHLGQDVRFGRLEFDKFVTDEYVIDGERYINNKNRGEFSIGNFSIEGMGRRGLAAVYDAASNAFDGMMVRFGTLRNGGNAGERVVFVDPSAAIRDISQVSNIVADATGVRVDFRNKADMGVSSLEDIISQAYGSIKEEKAWSDLTSFARSPGMSSDVWAREVIGRATGKKNVSVKDDVAPFIFGKSRWSVITQELLKSLPPAEAKENRVKLEAAANLQMLRLFEAARRHAISGVPFVQGGKSVGIFRKGVVAFLEDADQAKRGWIGIDDLNYDTFIHSGGVDEYYATKTLSHTGPGMTQEAPGIELSEPMIELGKRGFNVHVIVPMLARAEVGLRGKTKGITYAYENQIGLAQFAALDPSNPARIMAEMMHALPKDHAFIGMISSPSSPKFVTVKAVKYASPDEARKMYRQGLRNRGFKENRIREMMLIFDKVTHNFKDGIATTDKDAKLYSIDRPYQIIEGVDINLAAAKAKVFLETVEALDPSVVSHPRESGLHSIDGYFKRLTNFSAKKSFLNFDQFVKRIDEVKWESARARAAQGQPALGIFPTADEFGIGTPGGGFTLDIISDFVTIGGRLSANGKIVLPGGTPITDGVIYVRPDLTNAMQRMIPSDQVVDSHDAGYVVKGVINKSFADGRLFGKCSFQPMPEWLVAHYKSTSGKTHVPAFLMTTSTLKTFKVKLPSGVGYSSAQFKNGMFVPLSNHYTELIDNGIKRGKFLRIDGDDQIQFVFGEHETEGKLGWQIANTLVPSDTFRNDLRDTTYDSSANTTDPIGAEMRTKILAAFNEMKATTVAMVDKIVADKSADPEKVATELMMDAILNPDIGSASMSMLHNGVSPFAPFMNTAIQKAIVSKLQTGLFSLRMKGQSGISVLSDEIIGIHDKTTSTDSFEAVYTGVSPNTGAAIRMADSDLHQHLTVTQYLQTASNGKGYSVSGYTLKPGKIILPWSMAKNFSVGDKVVTFRVPINKGSGVVTLEVVGFRGKDKGNTVKTSAEHVFRTWEGDLDIDKIFIVRNKKSEEKEGYDISAMIDLFGDPTWQDHNLQFPLGGFDVVAANKRKAAADGYGETAFDLHAWFNAAVSAGGGQAAIGQLATISRVWASFHQQGRTYEFVDEGERYRIIPKDAGDVAKTGVRYGNKQIDLNVQQYATSISQASLDDVKEGGIINRKKYADPITGEIVDNDLYFNRAEVWSRLIKLQRQEPDGTWVDSDKFSGKYLGELVIEQTRGLEHRANSVVNGEDPATGKKLGESDILDYITEVESVANMSQESRDRFFRDVLAPFFASQDHRIAMAKKEIAARHIEGKLAIDNAVNSEEFPITGLIGEEGKRELDETLDSHLSELFSVIQRASSKLEGRETALGDAFVLVERAISSAIQVTHRRVAESSFEMRKRLRAIADNLEPVIEDIESGAVKFMIPGDEGLYDVVLGEANKAFKQINIHEARRIYEANNGRFELVEGKSRLREILKSEAISETKHVGFELSTEEENLTYNAAYSRLFHKKFIPFLRYVKGSDLRNFKLLKNQGSIGGMKHMKRMLNEYVEARVLSSFADSVHDKAGLADVILIAAKNKKLNRITTQLDENSIGYLTALAEAEAKEFTVRRKFKPGGSVARTLRVTGTFGEDVMTKLLIQSKRAMGFGNMTLHDSVEANRIAADDAIAIRLRELKTSPTSYFRAREGNLIVDAIYRSSGNYAKLLEKYIASAWVRGEKSHEELLGELARYAREMGGDDGRALERAVTLSQVLNEPMTNDKVLRKVTLDFIAERAKDFDKKDLGLTTGEGLGTKDASGLLGELIMAHSVRNIRVVSPVNHSFRLSDVTKFIPGIGTESQGDLMPFKDGSNTFVGLYTQRFKVEHDKIRQQRETMEASAGKITDIVDAIAQERAEYLDMEINPDAMTVKIGNETVLSMDKAELEKMSPLGAKITKELLEILRDYPEIRSNFSGLVMTMSREFAALHGQGWQGETGTGRITNALDIARMHNWLKNVLTSPDPTAKMVLGIGLRGHAFPENVANHLMSLNTVVRQVDKHGQYTGDKLLTPVWEILDRGRNAFVEFATGKDSYAIKIDNLIAHLQEGIDVKHLATELRLAYNLLENPSSAGGMREYAEQVADKSYWDANPGRQHAIRRMAEEARIMFNEVKLMIERHYGNEFSDLIVAPDGEKLGKGLVQAVKRMNEIFGLNMNVHAPMFKDYYAPRFWPDARKLKEEAYKYGRQMGKAGNDLELFVADIMARHQRPDSIYGDDGVINSDQRVSFFQHRGTEEIGGYSRDLGYVMKQYFSMWARKKAMDHFALHATYVMQAMKTGRGDMGSKLADRVRAMEKELPGSTDNWISYMDRLVRNAIGYPSRGNEKYFGFDLNDSTWAPRIRKVYSMLTGKDLEDPHQFMKWMSEIEGSYQLMALLAFPKAMLNNMIGGHLNIIKRIGYTNWKKAGIIATDVMKAVRDEADILTAFRKAGVNLDDKIMSDRGLMTELRNMLSSPAILANFTEFEAELAKHYDSGKIRSLWDDLRRGVDIKEAAERHGIASAVWKRMVQAGGSLFGHVEFKLRSRAFVAGFMHSYSTMKLPPDVAIRHGMELVRKTQFLYDALSLPEFRNSSMGKIITRFQPWAWNQFRFEADIVKEAASVGFTPGTPEYERFTRGMSINAFVIAMAAFLPFSLFGTNVPPPYQYGYEAAEALWNQDLTRLFGGTLGISMLTGPTVNNFIIGPSLALVTDNYGWNPWSVLPFGRAIGATYRTIAKPQYGIDYWTGVPVMDLHNLIYSKEKEPDVKTIDSLLRSKPDLKEEDQM